MIREITSLVCFTLGFASNVWSIEAPIVRTIAGGVNGKTQSEAKGFEGDGRPAISAKFDKPRGLAVDSYGNLYIADTGNNRIRVVRKP